MSDEENGSIKSAVTAGNLASHRQLKVRVRVRDRVRDKYRWDTVSEYQDNPLVDNSDDERRLRQAETRVKLMNNKI
jgi:hypothetical protein